MSTISFAPAETWPLLTRDLDARPPRINPGSDAGPSAPVLAGADQARLVGEHDRLNAVPELQLRENVRHVRLDGGLAERQLRGELGVAQAAGEQPQHLKLPGGQARQVTVHHRLDGRVRCEPLDEPARD